MMNNACKSFSFFWLSVVISFPGILPPYSRLHLLISRFLWQNATAFFFPVLGFNSTVIFFCAGWSSAASFYFILLRQDSGLIKIIYWLLVDVAKEATFKSTSSVLISF